MLTISKAAPRGAPGEAFAAPASAADPAGFASLLRQTRSAAPAPLPPAPPPVAHAPAPAHAAPPQGRPPAPAPQPARERGAAPHPDASTGEAASRAAAQARAAAAGDGADRTAAAAHGTDADADAPAAADRAGEAGDGSGRDGARDAAADRAAPADSTGAAALLAWRPDPSLLAFRAAPAAGRAADAAEAVAAGRERRAALDEARADARLDDARGVDGAATGDAAPAADAAADRSFAGALAARRGDDARVDATGPAVGRHDPIGAAGAAAATAPAARADAAAPPTIAFATPPDAPDFPRAFGVQVSVLARDGVHRAELHLNPAEMGPVSVHIVMDGSQARVDFGADVAATRQAIEAGLPELASALRDAGFTLAGGGVSQHARGGAGSSGDASAGGDDAGRGREAAPEATAPRPALRRQVAAGGVDLFA